MSDRLRHPGVTGVFYAVRRPALPKGTLLQTTNVKTSTQGETV